jgi:putative transposase
MEQRILAYKSSKVSLSYIDQANELPLCIEEIPELDDVFSQTRQDVLKRLDKAFKAFFSRLKTKGVKAGFPRFRSGHRYDSFTYPQSGFKLDGNRVYLSRIGSVKVKLHRPIVGAIKTCTIKREVDQWYVVFSCDIPNSQELFELDYSSDIGIDVGLTTYAVTSDKEYIANPKCLKHSKKKLGKAQQILSGRKKGSNRRKKQRILVAKIHHKVKRQRDDFQHKVSRRLVDKYDFIYLEDLKINNMVKDKIYSFAINDASWGRFANMLFYKAEEAGKQVLFVNPKGTTQRCSQCQEIVPKAIQDRWHCCPHCGFEADRDYNASLEIKRLGRSLRGDYIKTRSQNVLVAGVVT